MTKNPSKTKCECITSTLQKAKPIRAKLIACTSLAVKSNRRIVDSSEQPRATAATAVVVDVVVDDVADVCFVVNGVDVVVGD